MFTIDKDMVVDKVNELVTNALAQSKLNELLHKQEEPAPAPKKKNGLLIALAVIGGVAAVAGIAYCVYRFVCPDYLEDFDEEEFDDEEEQKND